MKLSRTQKIVAAVSTFALIYAVVGFLVLPAVLESMVPKKLSETLGRKVSLERIAINPFTFTVKTEGFRVKKKDSDEICAGFKELYGNVQIASLFKWALIVKEFRLIEPKIFISRIDEKTFSFSDITEKLKQGKTKEEKPEQKEDGFGFSINNIRISGGRAVFEDKLKSRTFELNDLEMGLPFLSNLEYRLDTFTEPYFSAVFNGEPLSLKGKTKPFKDTRETVLNIDLEDIDLAYYFTYVPMDLNFDLDSGLLDLDLQFSFVQSKGETPRLEASGILGIEALSITDKRNAEVLSVPRMHVKVSPSRLLEKTLNVEKVLIGGFKAGVVREKDGGVNLVRLFSIPKRGEVPGDIESEKKEEKERNGDEEGFTLNLADFEFTNGKITFSDLSLPGGFEAGADSIYISIQGFSSKKGAVAEYVFSARTDFGEECEAQGTFSAFPFFSEGSAEIHNIIVDKYSAYYGSFVDFQIRNDDLTLGTDYSFSRAEGSEEIQVNELFVKLKGLEVLFPGEKKPPLAVNDFEITGTSADVKNRSLEVGSVKTRGGKIWVERTGNNEINILKLLPARAKEKGEKPATDEARSAEEGRDAAWGVRLRQAEVSDYKVSFSDRATPEPVNISLDNIQMRGENLSTEKDEQGKIDLSADFDRGGKVGASSSLTLNPLGLDAEFRIESFGLSWFRPYYMKHLNVLITGGRLWAKGRATADLSGEISARAKASVDIKDFSAVDESKAENLMKWKSFRIEGMGLEYAPLSLDIEKAVLVRPVSHILVRKDGSVNLTSIMAEDGGEKGPSEKGGTGETEDRETEEGSSIVPVKIGEVSIESGMINFEDRSIQPKYVAEWNDIQLNGKDLDSTKMKSGEVRMKSKINRNFPFEASGRLNPVAEDMFVDLEIKLADMDLSPLTPYSGKYIGKTVEKGKLSLNLDYFIKENKLDSKNKVFIDQLTFGKSVPSEDATSLPVGLAVSLLKDREGRIRLDLPVTGKLDDPSFSIGGVIFTMVKNLLVKAATSPFSLVSAVVGGGEELSRIEFGYGSSDLSEESLEKLDLLADALYKRPELNVELEGYANVVKDKEALLEERFMNALKSIKLKETVEGKESAQSLEEIKIGQGEYEKYLWEAYKKGDFDKPRNIIGLVKKVPAENMENSLRRHLAVSEEDLRILAQERAKSVRDFLIETGRVEAGRIFLKEPESIVPKPIEGAKESRVEVSLK